MEFLVKKELVELPRPKDTTGVSEPVPVIDLSSSDSDDSDDSGDSDYDVDDIIGDNGKRSVVLDGLSETNLKKQRMEKERVVLPAGFLDPLTPMEPSPALLRRHSPSAQNANASTGVITQNLKQFWKAGDYEGAPYGKWDSSSVGIDHVRVHPKFLHSNATSHKWALGAFAELLDNALDETCSGATYVNIDMLENKKDGNKMLLIEDNGGGMDPDKMRQCMSLGYSIKSKIANTIGQYGNGFKTSTMRLGADVIVFSRCCGKDGISPTQSIGLLSYTFLRSTGKEDIVVPMLDYKRGVREWNKLIRSTPGDWNKNVETIVHWSPFSSEADLLQQFNLMKDHGTRIIIYNLWEDDEELLELDFDSVKHDIQLRGVNRDEKNIKMAQENPNSRHFLTYRHSLRSYASILYLRLPPGFRIILRGIDVEHHNIVNDMMRIQEITYRPQPSADGIPKESNGMATVTIGFVKDAKNHLDVQGFNVYHKNRLIKPFWRLWNAAGSDGRGVIGVVEANFVEPAHDKQDFERTTVLARLEARLVLMQKHYWSTNCHEIGYAPRRHKSLNGDYRETSPDYLPPTYSQHKNKGTSSMGRSSKTVDGKYGNGHVSRKTVNKSVNRSNSSEPLSPSSKDNNDDDMQGQQMNGSSHNTFPAERSSEKYATGASRPSSFVHISEARQDFGSGGTSRPSSFVHISEARQDFGSGGTTVPATISLQAKGNAFNGNVDSMSNFHSFTIDQLKEENRELRERLKKKEAEVSKNLQLDLLRERDRCRSLETQLQEKQRKIEEMNREQETLIDIFSEERDRRDIEEENLRKKLKDASNTIQELLDKVRLLERR